MMRERKQNSPMLDRQVMTRLDGAIECLADQIGKDMNQRKNIVGRTLRLGLRSQFDDRPRGADEVRSLGSHE
jgi:hypothetical protein